MLIFKIFLCAWLLAYMYVCVPPCMSGARGSQKKVLDPLELELTDGSEFPVRC